MSEPNDKPQPDFTAQLDQIQTHLENFANLIEMYYQKLEKSGLPPELIHELVVEFQRMCMTPRVQ